MNHKPTIVFFYLLLSVTTIRAQGWPHRYFPPELPKQVIGYDFSNQYGGLICVNLSTPSTVYSADYCLIRINQMGDTLWTKKNLFNGPLRAIPRVVKQMHNGDYFVGFALSDTVKSINREIGCKFIRIDSNGNTINTISRRVDRENGKYMNVEPTSDNGYYISYSYDSLVYLSSGTDAWVYEQSVIERYDSSNVRLWTHRIQSSFSNMNYLYCLLTVVRTVDDGVFYITQDRVGKLRSDGSPVFEHPIGVDLAGYSFDLYPFCTSDSGVVISLFGTVQHLCKYNDSGALVFNETVPTNSSYYAEGIEVTNGKYLIAGGVKYPDSCGFYLFDKNMNKIDSIVKPYWDTSFTHAPLSLSANGEAFYAVQSRLSLSSYDFHVFAAKVDTMFNIHRHLVTSLTSNCLVPGYTSHLDVSLHNNGSFIVDTTVTVVLDSSTYFATSSRTPISITGDTLTFAIDSLLPDSILNITVNVLVDSTIGLGTLLTFYSNSPYPNNIGITDDSVVYSNATVSSFDPNFKAVNKPFYFVPEGRTLIYTIGYENTGNFPARNIKIRDTIDRHLDMSTIRVISAKPQFPDIIRLPDNEIIFNLPDINLPDSAAAQDEYHGQFSYAIDLASNAGLGDTIKNTANIIFDYNIPVVTNTTTNIISDKNGPFENVPHNFGLVVVFPNPSTGLLNVVLPFTDKWSISILDLYGRCEFTGNYNADRAEINTDISAGFYVMKVVNLTSGENRVQKIVIKG